MDFPRLAATPWPGSHGEPRERDFPVSPKQGQLFFFEFSLDLFVRILFGWSDMIGDILLGIFNGDQ